MLFKLFSTNNEGNGGQNPHKKVCETPLSLSDRFIVRINHFRFIIGKIKK